MAYSLDDRKNFIANGTCFLLEIPITIIRYTIYTFTSIIIIKKVSFWHQSLQLINGNICKVIVIEILAFFFVPNKQYFYVGSIHYYNNWVARLESMPAQFCHATVSFSLKLQL